MRPHLALCTLTCLLVFSGCRIISGVEIAPAEDDGLQEDMSPTLDMQRADEGTPAREEMGSDLAEMEACEPGEEICDGEDNDCNGQTDEGCDDDGDGYCDINLARTDGAACDPGDCDDTRPDKNPGAKEPCPATEDLNCDGELRAYTASLTALQPIIPPGSIGTVGQIALERGPNETFGLFWIESNALEAQVKFRRLGANGQPLSEPVTLSNSNEVVHTYTPIWHEPSNSWVVVSKSYARDAYNYVHHVDTFNSEGVKRGARQLVATSEVGRGFLGFFTSHELVLTGDTVLILYTTAFDGVIDVFARSFEPASRELGDSLRLYGDLGLYQLSWAYRPPVEGAQHGHVVFKETESMTKNPKLPSSFEVLQLRLGMEPSKSTKYVNLDTPQPYHNEFVVLGDELGLYFYEPREDTPQNGRDYKLFVQKLDENFKPTGARLELDSIATRLSTSARVDENHTDLLYYTAPSVQETRHIVKRLRLDTFEFTSNRELTSYDWSEDYYQQAFIYTPGANEAQTRQHILNRKNHDADGPPYKVTAFNQDGQLLGEYDLFTNIMLEGELETPQESRARLLEDGTYEWLDIDYNSDTQERSIAISRILPDGSPDGPHLFSPPITGNYCSANFVGDEVICARESVDITQESGVIQSCSAKLLVYRGDARGATVEGSTWDIPHLIYRDSMDRERCISGYALNSASATVREDGTLVYLAKKRENYDAETSYLTGSDIIIEIDPEAELTVRELGTEVSAASVRVYEVDATRKLLFWVNQYADHKIQQQWVTTDYAPLEPSPREFVLPAPPMEGEEVSILPFYPREEIVHGGNHWFFYAIVRPQGTHTFWAQASPLDITAPIPPPIAIGSMPSSQNYRLNPFYATHVGAQVHLSIFEQNTDERASRSYVITFDAESGQATTPAQIEPMHEDPDSYASYPGIFTEDDGSLIVLFVGLTEQLFEFYDDRNVLQQQLSLSLQTLSNHTSQIPPVAIRGWRLEDGSIRWPIWSNSGDNAALINLTCK